MAFAITAAALLLFSSLMQQSERISYQFFKEQVAAGNVESVYFVGDVFRGRFKKRVLAPVEVGADGVLEKPKQKDGQPDYLGLDFTFELPDFISDEERNWLSNELLQDVRIDGTGDRSGTIAMWLTVLFSLIIIFFVWTMFRRTREQFMGGGFLSGFSKSPAKTYERTDNPITFDDVAGLEGVKADLEEIVEFLKSPERFQRLGGRVPKGVLLNGPPGTGKTLLARAVAGEAGVPFFSVNGSEFIQMFVGVGASRVRDLFQKAKQASPSIVFIDEIDAVGRQRGAGLGGGHDEREQTLNQILSEMDGFTPSETVIVMAATNRPDVLDPALLRPGRFDRHITVDRPTLRGRIAIFKVHVRDVPLGPDVDLKRLAEGTVGLTGADIRNLVNEAALWATRQNKKRVEMDDFETARDKVLMGPKREEILTGEEKEKTAYHEAGHALMAWMTKGVDRIHKVTVIPRGRALGVTQTLPEEDRMNITESELQDRLAFLLGGRAAEKLVYHEFSAGAENDLERATDLARHMVTKWGMSERLGPVSYKLSDQDPFLGREMHEHRQISEHTLQTIDEEVARILHDSADRALTTLSDHREQLDRLAEALIEREELNEKEIEELIGPSARDESKPSSAEADEFAAASGVIQREQVDPTRGASGY
jgi:cell division protease FtsH